MRKHTALVTVLMPVFNGARYLASAIESILGQSFDDFEFLIVDDASTDESRALIRGYSDSRVRLVENSINIGQTNSLNRGLGLARGLYVARLDADDIALPQRLGRQVDYLARHPETALLASASCYIDADGRVWRQNPAIATLHNAIAWQLIFNNCLPHSSIMMRRQAVVSSGGYNMDFKWAQDYELYSHWIRSGERLACLPEPLVQIRWHTQSMTHSVDRDTQLEPVRTSRANFRYLLPDLETDILEKSNTILRNAILGEVRQPATAADVQEAIAVLFRLFEAFCAHMAPSAGELVYLKRDVASKLAVLAAYWRRVHPSVAANAFRTSFIWDPGHGATPLGELRHRLVNNWLLPRAARASRLLRIRNG